MSLGLVPCQACCVNDDTLHTLDGEDVRDVAQAADTAPAPRYGLGVGPAYGLDGAHDGHRDDQHEPLSLSAAVLAIDQADPDIRLCGRDPRRTRVAQYPPRRLGL